MQKDRVGNAYEEVRNIRLTFVKSTEDSPEDKLRIQAYREANSNSLHQGAQIKLKDKETILEIIEALCKLYRRETKETAIS